jgi:hypothetical protein
MAYIMMNFTVYPLWSMENWLVYHAQADTRKMLISGQIHVSDWAIIETTVSVAHNALLNTGVTSLRSV